MRRVVMQMMTSLNGRVDDPDSWVTSVPADLYAELDRLYEGFDAILIGRATYEEMVEYWPGAESDPGGSESGRSMARKMNSYRKHVITRDGDGPPLEWNASERVAVQAEADLSDFVRDLKARPGADIHLAGGAELARTMVRLGLVDRFNLFVHPVTSPGTAWFEGLDDQRGLELVGSAAYSNGVVGLSYEVSGPGR